MKKRIGLLVPFLVVWQCACFAAVDERGLIEFWKTTMGGTSISASEQVSRLKALGVHDVNILAPYLNSKEFQKSALDSMWALAPESKPPTAEVFNRVIALSYNRTVGVTLHMAAIRLLFNYYPDEPMAQRYFSDSSGKRWDFRADASSYELDILGEWADRYPAKRSYAYNSANVILGFKVGYSRGDVMAPPEGSEHIPVILSAMRWKLYDDPELARRTASFLFERLTRPFRLSVDEVRPVIEFLLHQSKADPEFLAKGFYGVCAGNFTPVSGGPNSDRASVILWLLNESKDSPVAQRALALCSNDTTLIETLRAIQSRKVSRADAFDRPLKEYYPLKEYEGVPVKPAGESDGR